MNRLTTLMALVLGVSPAMAAPITLPTGLNPGDQYRLAFVTSSSRDASSTNIADYNSFVDALGDTVIASDWTAIASTATVTARTNTGTDPSPAGDERRPP